MHRAVFDTVIFVRALLDSRSFSGRLVLKHINDYRLFLAHPLIEEILEVLGRKEIIERFNLRNANYPKALADLLKSMQNAEIVEISKIISVSRDPNDDKFLATAKAANAHYLVSADLDLLDLKEYEGIKIVDAETFLHVLETNKKL